jgi:DNA primase
MISRTTIEEIQQRVSLLDVVEATRSTTRSGRNFKCLCPFHQETTPSFYIYTDSNSYYCFGCQASGNTISYIMNIEGLSFPEAIERLALQGGITVQQEEKSKSKGSISPRVSNELLYRVNLFAQRLFENRLLKAPESVALYLESRGVSKELVSEFSIGYAPQGVLLDALKAKKVDMEVACLAGLLKKKEEGGYYEYFRDRVVFPIRTSSERVLGFGGRTIPEAISSANQKKGNPVKYLNSPESPLYRKNSVLYSSLVANEAIRLAGEVYVVEGYFDVVSLHCMGVANVVATCGTAFTEDQTKRLSRLAKRITLLFDGDKAGYVAATRAIRVLGASTADIKVLFLPEGEDPDSFALKHGDDTPKLLAQLERFDVIEVYLRKEIESYGGDATKLSAPAKYAIVLGLKTYLRSIANKMVLNQIIETIGYKLGLSTALVQQMLRESNVVLPKGDAKEQDIHRFPTGKINTSSLSKDSLQEKTERHKNILAPLDRSLILAALVLQKDFPEKILRETAVVVQLAPTTLLILQDVMENPQAAISSLEQQQELLVEAEQMRMLPGEQKKAFLQQCVRSIRKARVRELTKSFELRIRSAQNDDEKQRLVQEQILLLRTSEALSFDDSLE